MNYDKKKLYMSCAAMLCAFSLACFIPDITLRRVAVAVLAAAFCAWIGFVIKKRTQLALEKNNVAWLLPLIAAVAVVALYVSGIKFGFYRQDVGARTLGLTVLPTLITIVATEMTRCVLLMQGYASVSILAYLSTAAAEIAVLYGRAPFGNMVVFTNFFGLVVFPVLVAGFLYQYIAQRYGALPNILYRCIFTLYSLILPIQPHLPTALSAFAKLLLPLLAYAFLSLLFERKKRALSRNKFSVRTVMSAVFVVFITLFVMLISCRFRYGMLVIATDSMTGTIDRGDAIIYRAYDGEVLEEGQVAVFEKNGLTYVHRIVQVEHIDGEIRYYTKGDHNETRDTGHITKANIVGTTDVTIKYFGYPTLWMRDIFK